MFIAKRSVRQTTTSTRAFVGANVRAFTLSGGVTILNKNDKTFKIHSLTDCRKSRFGNQVRTLTGYVKNLFSQSANAPSALPATVLWARLSELAKEKEEVLREKEEVLREKAKEKEEVLREKAKEKEEVLREKEGLLREIADLRLSEQAVASRLRDANDHVLALESRRSVRGAVEYIAEKHSGTSSNVQAALNSMLESKSHGSLSALRLKIQHVSVHNAMREAEILKAFKHIYHSLSLHHHATGPRVEIREAEIDSPAERAALGALFELNNVKYFYIDKSGREILSPYGCACQGVTACS